METFRSRSTQGKGRNFDIGISKKEVVKLLEGLYENEPYIFSEFMVLESLKRDRFIL